MYLFFIYLFSSSGSLILIPHILSISKFCELHFCILIRNLTTAYSDTALAKSRSSIPWIFAVTTKPVSLLPPLHH